VQRYVVCLATQYKGRVCPVFGLLRYGFGDPSVFAVAVPLTRLR
jgi:hypothetical protein